MDAKNPTSPVSQIAHDILSYLVKHPTAHDTFEGIVEWWLLQQEVRRQTVAVRQALGNLVATGFVMEAKTRDGRVHYRLNRQKEEDIHRALAEWPLAGFEE